MSVESSASELAIGGAVQEALEEVVAPAEAEPEFFELLVEPDARDEEAEEAAIVLVVAEPEVLELLVKPDACDEDAVEDAVVLAVAEPEVPSRESVLQRERKVSTMSCAMSAHMPGGKAAAAEVRKEPVDERPMSGG